ncbi:MAG TPA: hypothetical protein DHV28_00965 [Ignavibacteriales bacterium]|nr:hypothetical protein [Ignavibacteriales bacterium]
MKKIFKKAIYENDILFKLYFNYLYKPKDKLEKFINEFSRLKKNDLFFIQIGANDGHWNDPIYKFIRRDNWAGILIEPQKTIFERLINNYKNIKNLSFENAAIDAVEGEKSLFKISFSNSQWASGISSFIKNYVQKLIDAGYIERMSEAEKIILPSNREEWISEEKVKVTTLNNLINKYQVKKIDLIMIDAEGYDFEIIKTIPFELVKPTIIIYEHSHFDGTTKNECLEYLKKMGYKLVQTDSDTIAELI